MERIRSFIAIEIPEKIRDKIMEFVGKFQQQDYDVRWVKYENLHLTLCFLGNVSKDFLHKATDKLSAIVTTQKSFELSLKNFGAFPSLRSPRVIWIGVEKGGNELIDLQAKIESTMAEIGYKPEERRFHPHLTIGRVKKRIDNDIIFTTQYNSGVFLVNSITLFKSILTPDGPIYEKIHEFPFKS
ncbi:MAG: RNA 2',3'-cyclic phosphodiesterase [candidate division WOR-3 bacterium]